mmetsp:Transcript_25996/g.46226  ORF Transcript_25996/g.46226 Transcript_25996/m.46226 type:complete len:221 (+) Transcript_25996:281-943(+)
MLMPRSSKKPAALSLSMITPMLPVSVPGCATILSAAQEMKYPPLAHTLPMLTTTTFPASRSFITSRWMESEAVALPPGESTRSTTALVAVSFRSASSCLHNVTLCTLSRPPLLPPCFPWLIAPIANTSATVPGCSVCGRTGNSHASRSPFHAISTASHHVPKPSCRQCEYHCPTAPFASLAFPSSSSTTPCPLTSASIAALPASASFPFASFSFILMEAR